FRSQMISVAVGMPAVRDAPAPRNHMRRGSKAAARRTNSLSSQQRSAWRTNSNRCVAAFTRFLQRTLGHAAALARSGAVAFVCMDWRHMGELLEAGQSVFSELKNLCIWNKTNAGMGTFYRSKHELVFVFKVGTASHTNTFG